MSQYPGNLWSEVFDVACAECYEHLQLVLLGLDGGKYFAFVDHHLLYAGCEVVVDEGAGDPGDGLFASGVSYC